MNTLIIFYTRIIIFILPQILTDGHGFTMRMVVVLNTNITNIFGHTDRHRWTRIFTMRRITLFILPQMSDEHRFGIFKVALTKTIKTPNCIFRSLRLYIVCRNSLSESKLSSIDLQQTMSQSMLCFLKIQLGDKHEKHQHNLCGAKLHITNVATMFFQPYRSCFFC